jgi:hypothetical protein
MSKRENLKKGRPWLVASEKDKYLVLRIYYPDGRSEILQLFGEAHVGWIGSKLDYNCLKNLDKLHGFKTHFLGNL